MAVGNTFGATALSSYGGFWLSFAIILTPGGFEIEANLSADGPAPLLNSLGFYLMVCLSSPYLGRILTINRVGSSSPPSSCSAP